MISILIITNYERKFENDHETRNDKVEQVD
jgi:hypothetical protein